MTRRRRYLLIAAIGIAGIATLGVLNTARLSAARRDHPLHDYDWSSLVQVQGSNAVANAVRVVSAFDSEERRFSYYTGAVSGGSGQASAAPARVIAEGAHGAVTVRLRAFEPYSRDRAGDDAAEVARIVSQATTSIWPAQATPVQIDVHFMPDEVPFSLAKRVDWQDGDPYAIAVFARDRLFVATVAAHELYHALAGRWSLGNKDPTNGATPNRARAYEEITAELFAQCGRLLATGSLSRDSSNLEVVIDGQRFEGELAGEELARALDFVSRDARGSGLLGYLLVRTVVADMFGEEETIVLESRQGERFLSRCRETAANPMLLGFRLANLSAGQ